MSAGPWWVSATAFLVAAQALDGNIHQASLSALAAGVLCLAVFAVKSVWGDD